MKAWIDTYPHEIYASVLIFKSKVKHKSWIANSKEEHQIIFNVKAKKWIKEQDEMGS